MENFGNGSSPFETPETGADKSDTKDKKKKSKLGEAGIFERIRDEDKKHKAEKDLAKSLDNMPLFERINVDSDKPKGEDKTAELPEQAAEKPSAEAAPERLTDDETREAQQRIARDHLKSMEQADPAAAEELAPAKDFLERVEAGDNTDEAFKEAAAEAGLDEAETADALATEASTENETVDNTDETVQYSSSLEGDPEETSFDTNADDEGEFSWRSGSGSGSSTSGGGPGSAGGQSGGGAGPGGPGSPGGPFGPGGIPGGPGGPGYGPNVGPNAGPGAGFNVMPAAANTYYVQRSGAGDFLLGGLVGYLIGRRRGRIKTEKRLKPIQKRLEKQVNALEKDITSKEQQLVAAKAAKQAETAKVQAAEGRVETLAKSGNRTVEKSRVESRLGLTKPEPAEKLGHVAMIAEKLPGAREKTTEKVRRQRPNNIRQAFRPEDVKTLQRRELLELSEKILVEGASLRSIFESNLVGEKQLRHLVAEYLAGKDIRDELRHEMVEHEIDFNRDPLLRDRVRSQVISDAQTSGLTNLLQKAGVLPEEAAVKAAKAAEMARHEAAVKAAGRQSSSKAAAIAMGTAIVVLALLVIYLLLRG